MDKMSCGIVAVLPCMLRLFANFLNLYTGVIQFWTIHGDYSGSYLPALVHVGVRFVGHLFGRRPNYRLKAWSGARCWLATWFRWRTSILGMAE